MRRYGTAEHDVILLHGGPGAAGYMAPIARELSDEFQVLEPLQRRSGNVPLTVARHVEDLRAVVTECCARGAPAIVGSSWGAQLALAFAATHPTLTGPIVLVGPGTFTAASSAEFSRRLDDRRSTATKAAFERVSTGVERDAALASEAEDLVGPYSYEPISASLELAWVDAQGTEETWGNFVQLRDEGVYPEAFRAITVPVLMIHGDTDPHPGEMIRDSLLPVLPQLEYVELARCGHYPWLERFGRGPFFETLREWLSAHTTRRV
ncbi:MAG: alpha/beta fold hydrolase [Dehalococcoidia bacterium]